LFAIRKVQANQEAGSWMGHTNFSSTLMSIYLVKAYVYYKGKNVSVTGHSKNIGPEVNA
jgi:hypothetical protein